MIHILLTLWLVTVANRIQPANCLKKPTIEAKVQTTARALTTTGIPKLTKANLSKADSSLLDDMNFEFIFKESTASPKEPCLSSSSYSVFPEVDSMLLEDEDLFRKLHYHDPTNMWKNLVRFLQYQTDALLGPPLTETHKVHRTCRHCGKFQPSLRVSDKNRAFFEEDLDQMDSEETIPKPMRTKGIDGKQKLLVPFPLLLSDTDTGKHKLKYSLPFPAELDAEQLEAGDFLRSALKFFQPTSIRSSKLDKLKKPKHELVTHGDSEDLESSSGRTLKPMISTADKEEEWSTTKCQKRTTKPTTTEEKTTSTTSSFKTSTKMNQKAKDKVNEEHTFNAKMAMNKISKKHAFNPNKPLRDQDVMVPGLYRRPPSRTTSSSTTTSTTTSPKTSPSSSTPKFSPAFQEKSLLQSQDKPSVIHFIARGNPLKAKQFVHTQSVIMGDKDIPKRVFQLTNKNPMSRSTTTESSQQQHPSQMQGGYFNYQFPPSLPFANYMPHHLVNPYFLDHNRILSFMEPQKVASSPIKNQEKSLSNGFQGPQKLLSRIQQGETGNGNDADTENEELVPGYICRIVGTLDHYTCHPSI